MSVCSDTSPKITCSYGGIWTCAGSWTWEIHYLRKPAPLLESSSEMPRLSLRVTSQRPCSRRPFLGNIRQPLRNNRRQTRHWMAETTRNVCVDPSTQHTVWSMVAIHTLHTFAGQG